MRISRIYTDQNLEAGGQLSLDAPRSHYLARVLKLRAGNPVVLFNGDGSDYAAEIVTIGSTAAELVINTRLPAAAESPLRITLVQAVSRGERMDYCLQKATELGVATIQTLLTERVEVRLDEKRLTKRMAHWHGVITSACEQSGRARLPNLFPPIPLREWQRSDSSAVRLVLEPGTDLSLTSRTFNAMAVELLIGPEGGLSEAELQDLDIAGVIKVCLGPRVLRTETAGPAAIAVLQAMAGDF
jgi:16S rRNA (uracil1498-N3)-methyltransferase